jgi:hypothetical protein
MDLAFGRQGPPLLVKTLTHTPLLVKTLTHTLWVFQRSSQCSPAAAAAAAAAVPIAAIGVRTFNGAWLFAKPGPFDGKVDADA